MEKNGWLKKYFFVFSHVFSIFRIRFFLFLPKRYRAILWFFYFLFISICCPRTRPNSPLMQLLFSEQPINKIGWNSRSTLNSSHSSCSWPSTSCQLIPHFCAQLLSQLICLSVSPLLSSLLSSVSQSIISPWPQLEFINHHVWIRISFVIKLISGSRSSKTFTMESCHMWGESRTIWIEESCQQRGSNCFEFKEARSRTVLNSICNVFICHICQDKVTSDSIMSNVFLIDSFWAAAPLTTPLPHPIKC